MPIVVVVLNRVGFATHEKLVKVRPYVVVGAFILAAIFTPPDALSQLLLAVPLVVLFQLGIWLVKMFGKSSEEIEEMKAKQANEDE